MAAARTKVRLSFFRICVAGLTCLLSTGCSTSDDPEVLFRAGDYEAAYSLFRERVAEGDVAAVNFLGIHYYLGAGVEQDHARAVRFFERTTTP